mmetsp:Transcript_12963/g.24767  ORF Transcript_12963/g.24767 Transcript_12963/m.24767 type:complete len:553 (-) Transcript_12963:1095-2753(-)
MPALVIYGYRSKLAGDDLFPICILNGIMRILELLLLLPAMTLTFVEYIERIDDDCFGHRSHVTRIGIIPVPYLGLSSFFATFTICLSMWIYVVSGRGSPTEPESRRGIGRLFVCMVFVTPLILAVLTCGGILGTSYVDSRLKCVGHLDGSKPHWYYMMVAILAFQCFEVLVYAICLWKWIKFELRERIKGGRRKNLTTITTTPQSSEARRAEEWDKKCKCCCKYTAFFCCFSFGGRGIRHEDFSSMASFLAELFSSGGTLDVVASDVIVAFMAIAMKQEEEKRVCIERWKEEAGEDGGADLPMLDQATTNEAVAISAPLKAFLNISAESDIEAGTSANRATPSDSFNTTADNGNNKQKRRSAFIFRGTRCDDDKNFAIRELLSTEFDVDRYAIAEGARFLRYSIAINTAKGYLFNNLSTNCCKLMYARCYEMPKHNRQKTGNNIIGNDPTGLNEAAFMKVVGFDKSKAELHYAHLDNTVDQAVYCILADHVWKSIVLCIRGSLSLDDYVVNLQVDPEMLDQLGAEYDFDGDGEYCHGGYLARAKWICQDLNR